MARPGDEDMGAADSVESWLPVSNDVCRRWKAGDTWPICVTVTGKFCRDGAGKELMNRIGLNLDVG